ncbi:aldehyde dehydrogenase family protein [Hippea jasoniae]|uniref:aldehyde dehydrogenase family protein n=1 Tax=Hippea jasoniae TaxID=944479 RepID=UPI00054F72AE|nr:aldehyde dehydrogenase family protein [Hippea jasoniae]
MKQYKTLIGGKWVSSPQTIDVIDKYSSEIIAKVPKADKKMVDEAVDAADKAFSVMKNLPAYRRSEILEKAANLIKEREEEITTMICREAGKAWKNSIGEVRRGYETFKFAAEEAKRIHGETVPMDASASGVGRFGYFIRVPMGVIGAITPFNFPLNLVAHKVAPAIASGNTVVLKPASTTPITALILGEILMEAGLPDGALNIVIGPGQEVGEAIITNDKVRKITFTGSAKVGDRIMRIAGIKRVTLELGNNSATIIEKDADIDKAIPRCIDSAFANSGQVCISLQRIYVHKDIADEFTEKFAEATKKLKIGNPVEKDTDLGPMIDENEALRAKQWIDEAVSQGAELVVGGKVEGRILYPTVLRNTTKDMRVMCMEVFAPIVSIVEYDNFEEAIQHVNDSDYGLQAGIYTNDIKKIHYAIDNLDVGGVMINDTSIFRVDHMPYGGNKMSGIGREGVRFAIEEMTNIKMVMINLN